MHNRKHNKRTNKKKDKRHEESEHISSVRLAVLPIALGEVDEAGVDAVDAEGLDQSRHRQQVGEGGGERGRPAAAVDEGTPRRHQLHHLGKSLLQAFRQNPAFTGGFVIKFRYNLSN